MCVCGVNHIMSCGIVAVWALGERAESREQRAERTESCNDTHTHTLLHNLSLSLSHTITQSLTHNDSLLTHNDINALFFFSFLFYLCSVGGRYSSDCKALQART